MSEAHKIYPLTVECFILPWVLEGDFSCLLLPLTLGEAGEMEGGCAKKEEEALLSGPAKRRRRASSSVVGPVSLFPHLELNSHPR